jgi:glutathione S-transferase
MLTLFHAPHSRSTRIVTLAEEMGIDLPVHPVRIPRQDGSGGRDPANPHPEGKVPLLVHDGVPIRESAAIMLYLTDLFPEAGLGVPPGDPQRGAYLGWLFWYGNVMEPVYVHQVAGLSHPVLSTTFRGVPEAVERIFEALRDGRPYLLGERYTAADLIVASPYAWFTEATPSEPAIRDWVRRCTERPAAARAAARDAEWVAAVA